MWFLLTCMSLSVCRQWAHPAEVGGSLFATIVFWIALEPAELSLFSDQVPAEEVPVRGEQVTQLERGVTFDRSFQRSVFRSL